MGWLHWTPEVTRNALMSEIVAACEGHMEMLRLIFGSSDETPPKPVARSLSPDLFDALF